MDFSRTSLHKWMLSYYFQCKTMIKVKREGKKDYFINSENLTLQLEVYNEFNAHRYISA